MSDQHDQHDEVVEDERLETTSYDERPVDSTDADKPSEGEVGLAVPDEGPAGPDGDDDDVLSWQDERYERASIDPEYAAQQGIEVDEDDRGDAWEYGSLERQAALENAEDLPVDGEDADDDDRSEEV